MTNQVCYDPAEWRSDVLDATIGDNPAASPDAVLLAEAIMTAGIFIAEAIDRTQGDAYSS